MYSIYIFRQSFPNYVRVLFEKYNHSWIFTDKNPVEHHFYGTPRYRYAQQLWIILPVLQQDSSW